VEAQGPARVDLDLLAGNALRLAGAPGAPPAAEGVRPRLADGARLVRRLAVDPAWFRLPENAGPLDLPAAEIGWASECLALAPAAFLYLDEELHAARLRLETDKGEMLFALEPEKAPDHVKNVLRLARAGFYDGTLFHRVIRDYAIQGGDGATRAGGPLEVPWTVAAEFSCLAHVPGTLSMARDMRDPDSATSQFFVVCGSQEQAGLNIRFTVFGRLLEGDDTLEAIAGSPVSGETPREPIVLRRARPAYTR